MNQKTDILRGAALAVASLNKNEDLARAIGVTSPAVSQWLKRGIPPKRAKAVSVATGIPLHVLRPDIFPVPLEMEAA